MDDDSGESINGDDGDDANCSESESIFDCADDKDGAGGDRIGDGDVDINGSSDPNFRDDKTKVGRNANAAVNDGNAIDMVVLMMVLVLIQMIMVVLQMMLVQMVIIMMMLVMEIKMMVMSMVLMVVVMMKKVVVMMEVIMLMAILKMVVQMMVMIKMILILNDDDGVKDKFLQFNFATISTIFDANLSFPGSIRCK